MDTQISTFASGAQASDDQQFHNFLASQITEELRAGTQDTFSFTTVGPLDQQQYAELQRSARNTVGQPIYITMDALANTVTLAQGERQNSVSASSARTPQASEASSDAATEKPKKKVSRPPNAFIIYRKDQHATVVALNPGLHNNAISIIIGKQWNNETAEVRDMYQRKAADAKQQHLLDNPGYQYQPRKPSEKKKRMTKNKLAKLAAAKTSNARDVTTHQQAGSLQRQLPLVAGQAPMMSLAPPFVPAPELEFIDLPNVGHLGSFIAGDDFNGEFAAQIMGFNQDNSHLPSNLNVPIAVATTNPVNEFVVEGLQSYPMPVADPSAAAYGADYVGNQDGSLTFWDFADESEDYQPTFAGFELVGAETHTVEVHRQAVLDEEANNNLNDFFDFESFSRSDETMQ